MTKKIIQLKQLLKYNNRFEIDNIKNKYLIRTFHDTDMVIFDYKSGTIYRRAVLILESKDKFRIERLIKFYEKEIGSFKDLLSELIYELL